MLATLLCACFVMGSPSPGLDKPITYTTRAARSAVVLPELGRLAGLDLRVTPQTENEILVIQVKDQPIGDDPKCDHRAPESTQEKRRGQPDVG